MTGEPETTLHWISGEALPQWRVEETEAKNLNLRQRQPREDLGEREGSKRMSGDRRGTI